MGGGVKNVPEDAEGSQNVGMEDVVFHRALLFGTEVSRHEILHMFNKN